MKAVILVAGRHSVTVDFDLPGLWPVRWITRPALIVVILELAATVLAWIRERQ